MLHMPLAHSALWDDLKNKRRSIRISILIFSCYDNRISRSTHGLGVVGQGGAVVIKIFHLDGYGSCGCFTINVCVGKMEMRTDSLYFISFKLSTKTKASFPLLVDNNAVFLYLPQKSSVLTALTALQLVH